MLLALFSTISLVAAPGEAFNNGLTFLVFGMVVNPIFYIIAFFLFIRFYFRVKTLTPFEYLEHRFDHKIRLVGSMTFWFIRLMYLGTVLYASAKVFQGASQWPAWFTISLVGLIGILLTVMGGMKAVVWTNVLKFVVVMGAMAWVLTKCLMVIPGGPIGILTYAFEHGRGFQGVNQPDFFSLSPYVRLSFWALLLSAISNAIFSYSSDQMGIQHLLSTSSYAQAKKTFFTSLLTSFVVCIPLFFMGLAMFVFYAYYPPAQKIDGDTALFHFIATQIKSPGPGIVLSAMLAAVLSTLDAGITSLASVATQDIYIRYFNARATPPQQVRFSRLMIVAIGIISVFIGLMVAMVAENIGETFIEVGAIWMSLSAILPPLYLVGVTTTRVGARHMMWGVVLGWITTAAMVLWYVVSKGTDHSLSFLWTSLAGSIVMIIWCYLPAIFRCKPVDTSKTDGLTLWTLHHNAADQPVNSERTHNV
jgi:Na+/proline symporter